MPVYKQYSQAALNRQYNNRLHVPDYADHLAQWELLSRQTEKEYAVIKNVAYGKLSREQLDVYPSAQPQSKTLIFIHGGYWQKFDKSSFHFIAGAFHAYNITTVLLNYPLAPDVCMNQIILSCRKAVYWLYRNLSQFNGDLHQMYIAGHSAGGHLAAMLMATTRSQFNKDLEEDILKGGCAISGLYNLIPIQLSDINEVLKMDIETALGNSPVQLTPANQAPFILCTGAKETEEFKDQSNELYNCWKDKGAPMQLVEIPGLNHFSIVATMMDIKSSLHRVILDVMKT